MCNAVEDHSIGIRPYNRTSDCGFFCDVFLKNRYSNLKPEILLANLNAETTAVLCDQATIIGFICWEKYQSMFSAQPNADITSIWVDERYRRRGCGSSLLKHAFCKLKGCNYIDVTFGAYSTDIKYFLKSHQFELFVERGFYSELTYRKAV